MHFIHCSEINIHAGAKADYAEVRAVNLSLLKEISMMYVDSVNIFFEKSMECGLRLF